MAAHPVTDSLLFFCNGVMVTDPNPEPETTLALYLRRTYIVCASVCLTGTKIGCAEGGCGACTVMVSRFHPTDKIITHIAVNACLTPVCAVHGSAVTTVEGIGSTKTKLHPVQERLAKAHGSQCGFCTPGMVMSMYCLLRNNPQPDINDIMATMGGNLCRCTGYRPIIEGYKTFCKEKNYCGGVCLDTNTTDNPSEMARQLFDPAEFACYDPTQDIIFPPELLISSSRPGRTLTFRGQRVTWYRPVTLDDLVDLKDRFPQARLMAGNTEIGIEVKFKGQFYPVLVALTDVPELNQIEQRDHVITVGSSVSLSKLEKYMTNLTQTQPESRSKNFVAILQMLQRFAGLQIRNVASIGGNIMTSSPISDLNPIFIASKCSLEVLSKRQGSRLVPMDSQFFTGYRQNILEQDDVIKCIHIPFSNMNEYLCAFKQSPRREDDIAIVNAAMRVKFDIDSDIVEEIILAFGGMADRTIMATKTMNMLTGRRWEKASLEAAVSYLPDDLPLPAGSPGGMESYRKSLATSFFFKFFTGVLEKLQQRAIINVDSMISLDYSAITTDRPLTIEATQCYQDVVANQPSRDPVGRPIMHTTALQQATGEAVYVDDMPSIKGELFLTFVQSQRPHANIISVDSSEALAVNGVRHFVSSRDVIGSNLVGCVVQDEELFASKEVLHVGQPIGAILSDNSELGRRAAKLVKVDYEDLDSVITIEEAISKQSFFDNTQTRFDRGNTEEAFEIADHVIEGEVKVGGQSHFYMETQCCLAVPLGEDGEMEVFTSSQSPSETQMMIAKTLGLPANRITCRVKRLGGGFGGKQSRASVVASACAVAAQKTGHPVRVMLDRDEDMSIVGTRHPFLGRYKIGFSAQGRIVAADINLYSNAGCSLDLSAAVMEKAVTHVSNSYNFPVFRITGQLCRTNRPSSTAFRGFGAPQSEFIAEHIMTEVAIKCGIAQHKVREINLYHEGDRFLWNQPVGDITISRCWNDCIDRSNYKERKKDVEQFNRENRWKKRGISIIPATFGVAFAEIFLNQAGALVNIFTDGSVLVVHGGVEMGQGLHTKMRQIAARTLHLPETKIHLKESNSSTMPNATPTAASTGSDLNGRAVQIACEALLARLEPYVNAKPKDTWEEWVFAAYMDRVCLSASGFYKTPDLNYNWANREGKLYDYVSYGVAVSEVEIDCLTGDHRVMRTDIVMDVGESLNPAIDIGQIEGAFIQGYGMFTLEDHRWSPKGQLLTRGPGFYKIPTFDDVPAVFHVALLKDSTNPRNIFSSKAVGEPPLFLGSSVFFAIKDAITSARADAGVPASFRLDSPASADRIRMACIDRFTTMFPEPHQDSYTPFFVRP